MTEPSKNGFAKSTKSAEITVGLKKNGLTASNQPNSICQASPEDWESTCKKRFVLDALDRFEQKLTAYAMRLVGGDLHLARDAVQHSFLQLCRQNPPEIEPKLAAWLYTVCRNHIVDDLRSGFRRTSVEADAPLPDQKAIDPTGQLEERELLNRLRQLFECLHASEREVIELWSHGHDANEVGEILEMKPGTVRVNLHRAIKRLKQHPDIKPWLERATGQSLQPEINRLNRSKTQ